MRDVPLVIWYTQVFKVPLIFTVSHVAAHHKMPPLSKTHICNERTCILRCILSTGKSWPCPHHEGIWEEQRYTPLILSLNARQRSVTNFIQHSSPQSHWMGGWAGPRACLDALEKRNLSCPYQELKSRSSKPQPIHCTNYGILALPLSSSFNYSCKTSFLAPFLNSLT